MTPQLLRWCLALALLAAAAYTDLRWRTVPNWLTLAGGGLGLTVALVTKSPPLLLGVLVPFLVAALLTIYFGLREWMGFGDVKLILALMLLLNWYATLYVLLYGFVLAAAWTIGLLVWRGRLKLLWRAQPGEKPKVPLAPFLLVGAAIALVRF